MEACQRFTFAELCDLLTKTEGEWDSLSDASEWESDNTVEAVLNLGPQLSHAEALIAEDTPTSLVQAHSLLGFVRCQILRLFIKIKIEQEDFRRIPKETQASISSRFVEADALFLEGETEKALPTFEQCWKLLQHQPRRKKQRRRRRKNPAPA